MTFATTRSFAAPIVVSAAWIIGLLCLFSPRPASAQPAEFFNEFDWAPTAPTPGPTDFEIVFQGNVTGLIPPQNHRDPLTDPFPHPQPITIAYDPGANTTTVTFSGGALTPGHQYHFGLNQGFPSRPPLQPIAKVWTYGSAPPAPLPIVAVAPPANLPPRGPFKYAIIYLEAAFDQGGLTYGSWYELPYIPGGANQPVFLFGNCGTRPLFLSNTGIELGMPVPTSPKCKKSPTCASNAKLLNNLNFTLTPPPGQTGSRFVPIEFPPPAVLPPNPPKKSGPTSDAVTACP
jgi:hypothetical protein